ncbi:MAG: SDR family oxidoreductase [Gammaproteobacteria bacterium]
MQSKDLFNLQGRTALVTGGSKGIGLYIAEGLGEMGARVIITARKAADLEQAGAHLSALGIDNRVIACDASRQENIPVLVDRVLEHFGGLDILVNNAGTNWIAPAEDYPDAGWRKVMDLDIDAPFLLSREIGRRIMIPRRSGRIINIGSTAAIQGNGAVTPGGSHFIGYHAAKGALHSFTRGLAVEWGHHNITVNCLCPGFIATRGAAAYQATVLPGVLPLTPLRRAGGCDDIKGAAIFLASDAAAFMTGHTLVVDGGLSII